MKKDTIWLVVAIVLLLGVIGGLVWLFGGSIDQSSDVTDTSGDVVTQESEEEEEDTTESNPNTVEVSDEVLDDIERDLDVTYSTSEQSVGEDNEDLYTLSNIDVKKGEEVVEISYTFTGMVEEGSSLPVVVTNKSSLGVMEILFSNIEKDNSGLSFGESVDVYREGITKLSRVVSGVADTTKYALGFTDAPSFYLYEPVVDGSDLVVKLSVRYPGGDTQPSNLGMSDFTSEDVSIESSTADEGVRISGFSYSVSGGVLTYILKTSTNTGSPVPSSEGSLDEGILTVTFPSLNADIAYSSSNTVSLPGGITLNISRSGEQSTYEFIGVGDEFKLYGETSPNQVVIEVKL